MAETFSQAKREFLKQLGVTMRAATDEAAAAVLTEIQGLTSLTDEHDYSVLRQLDHPYATRHAPWSEHADWLVHEQAGSLLRGLRRSRAAGGRGIAVADIYSAVSHTWFLLLGTPRLRPRDFVSAALISRREQVTDIYRGHLTALLGEVASGVMVRTRLLDHDGHPAELPEG